MTYKRAIAFFGFKSVLETNANWLAANPSSFKAAGGGFCQNLVAHWECSMRRLSAYVSELCWMLLSFFGYKVHRQTRSQGSDRVSVVHMKPCMAIATICLGDKRKGVDDGLLRAAVTLSSASLFVLLMVVSEFCCRAKVRCYSDQKYQILRRLYWNQMTRVRHVEDWKGMLVRENVREIHFPYLPKIWQIATIDKRNLLHFPLILCSEPVLSTK